MTIRNNMQQALGTDSVKDLKLWESGYFSTDCNEDNDSQLDSSSSESSNDEDESYDEEEEESEEEESIEAKIEEEHQTKNMS